MHGCGLVVERQGGELPTMDQRPDYYYTRTQARNWVGNWGDSRHGVLRADSRTHTHTPPIHDAHASSIHLLSRLRTHTTDAGENSFNAIKTYINPFNAIRIYSFPLMPSNLNFNPLNTITVSLELTSLVQFKVNLFNATKIYTDPFNATIN
jgi:hypothetical protein